MKPIWRSNVATDRFSICNLMPSPNWKEVRARCDHTSGRSPLPSRFNIVKVGEEEKIAPPLPPLKKRILGHLMNETQKVTFDTLMTTNRLSVGPHTFSDC